MKNKYQQELLDALIEAQKAINSLDQAVIELLPGAKHISADILIINNALIGGVRANEMISAVVARAGG